MHVTLAMKMRTSLSGSPMIKRLGEVRDWEVVQRREERRFGNFPFFFFCVMTDKVNICLMGFGVQGA